MNELKYSEEDFVNDCDIFLSETEDINVNWLGDFVIISKRDVPAKQLEVLNSFNAHTKSLRLLSGMSAALEVEAYNASILSAHSSHLQLNSFPNNITPQSLNDLPFSISVGSIPNIDTMISRNDSAESVMRQLKKDVERDTLLINGNRIAGAQTGLALTLRSVGDFCNELISECGCTQLPSVMSEALSKAILSKASRTHAGGITFQSLQTLIDPSTQMLIPQSSSAVPLNVQIHIGAFPDIYSESLQRRHQHETAGTDGESRVQNRDYMPLDQEEEGLEGSAAAAAPCLVKVLYQDYVLLDLKLSSAEMTNPSNIVSDSKELGTVSLSYAVV